MDQFVVHILPTNDHVIKILHTAVNFITFYSHRHQADQKYFSFQMDLMNAGITQIWLASLNS